MSIKNITTDDLRRMNDSEGIIFQGCGGDPQEWVDGINELLTESKILLNGTRFSDVYQFQHDELTCLLFPFSGDVQLDTGKLAMWRLGTYSQFGGTWLTDFVENDLGGFENERVNQNQQTRKQNAPAIRTKIDRLVDGDGNTRAYASINVAGAVAIHGIRVMDSRKGVFVSMPNRSYKDSNGNTQYSDIAHAVTKEVREAINKQVLDAYNQALEESQNNGFTDLGDDEDLPFDEDEDGSMGFAPSM